MILIHFKLFVTFFNLGPGRPAHNAQPLTCSGEPIDPRELMQRELYRLERRRLKLLKRSIQQETKRPNKEKHPFNLTPTRHDCDSLQTHSSRTLSTDESRTASSPLDKPSKSSTSTLSQSNEASMYPAVGLPLNTQYGSLTMCSARVPNQLTGLDQLICLPACLTGSQTSIGEYSVKSTPNHGEKVDDKRLRSSNDLLEFDPNKLTMFTIDKILSTE